MTETPFNFVSPTTRYTQAHTSGPMTQHREEHGFSSWGYATKGRAAADGYTLRRGEAGKYAEVRFENGDRYRFYNEEQFHLA